MLSAFYINVSGSIFSCICSANVVLVNSRGEDRSAGLRMVGALVGRRVSVPVGLEVHFGNVGADIVGLRFGARVGRSMTGRRVGTCIVGSEVGAAWVDLLPLIDMRLLMPSQVG